MLTKNHFQKANYNNFVQLENIQHQIDNNLINYKIKEQDNEIVIFFDNKTFDLVGWQNTDIYQKMRYNRSLYENLYLFVLKLYY